MPAGLGFPTTELFAFLKMKRFQYIVIVVVTVFTLYLALSGDHQKGYALSILHRTQPPITPNYAGFLEIQSKLVLVDNLVGGPDAADGILDFKEEIRETISYVNSSDMRYKEAILQRLQAAYEQAVILAPKLRSINGRTAYTLNK